MSDPDDTSWPPSAYPEGASALSDEEQEGLKLRTKAALAALGIFGASLFFGDSMIIPAISVLSAVEGLKVVQPSLVELVVPITIVIIVALFASQRVGSAKVGRLFGPVMIAWFTAIGAGGVYGVARQPCPRPGRRRGSRGPAGGGPDRGSRSDDRTGRAPRVPAYTA
jgi:hypothetical protein